MKRNVDWLSNPVNAADVLKHGCNAVNSMRENLNKAADRGVETLADLTERHLEHEMANVLASGPDYIPFLDFPYFRPQETRLRRADLMVWRPAHECARGKGSGGRCAWFEFKFTRPSNAAGVVPSALAEDHGPWVKDFESLRLPYKAETSQNHDRWQAVHTGIWIWLHVTKYEWQREKRPNTRLRNGTWSGPLSSKHSRLRLVNSLRNYQPAVGSRTWRTVPWNKIMEQCDQMCIKFLKHKPRAAGSETEFAHLLVAILNRS